MAQKIQVRVKTNASEQKVENFGDRHYLVYLKSPAEDNKANIELLNVMSKILSVPAMKIKIVSGLTNKDKTLEIVY